MKFYPEMPWNNTEIRWNNTTLFVECYKGQHPTTGRWFLLDYFLFRISVCFIKNISDDVDKTNKLLIIFLPAMKSFFKKKFSTEIFESIYMVLLFKRNFPLLTWKLSLLTLVFCFIADRAVKKEVTEKVKFWLVVNGTKYSNINKASVVKRISITEQNVLAYVFFAYVINVKVVTAPVTSLLITHKRYKHWTK